MKEITIKIRKLTEKEKELNKEYIDSFYNPKPKIYHLEVNDIEFIGHANSTIYSIINYYKKKSGNI